MKKIVSELARRHHEKLVSFLFGLVRDRTTAEDLAQEAFVRVYRHAGDYKPIAKFTTWLFAIGRNLALNEVPIDVLAERLNTNRGALYKTLHDARRKLRGELAAAGLAQPEDSSATQQEEV